MTPYDQMMTNALALLTRHDTEVAALATENMTTNPNPKYRQDRCEQCAAGKGHYDQQQHHSEQGKDGKWFFPPCTAPTPEVYIAELEKDLDLSRRMDDIACKKVAELQAALVESERRRKEQIASLSGVLGGYQKRVGELEAGLKVTTDALGTYRNPDNWFPVENTDLKLWKNDEHGWTVAWNALHQPAVAAELARQKAQGQTGEVLSGK